MLNDSPRVLPGGAGERREEDQLLPWRVKIYLHFTRY